MIYLFCSASTLLYKRDALRSIAYPAGHIFRYRYLRKYVDRKVLDSLHQYEGATALLVYADTLERDGARDFSFYPLRKVNLLRLSSAAGAVYVDFRFGEFVNYGSDSKKRDSWDEFLKRMPGRPWPPKSTHQGSFLLDVDDEAQITTGDANQTDCWGYLVNQLDLSRDLSKSTFCLVQGFYYASQDRYGCYSETKLDAIDNTYDSIYPIPMGESVVLKLLLWRPTYDYDNPDSARKLSIKVGADAFASMSKNEVCSESRYDEDRTVLVCKRVFDNVLSFVSIEEPGDVGARSPHLTLLTKVRVPTWVIAGVVLLVGTGTFLLALDAEFFAFVATFLDGPWRSYLNEYGKVLATLTKLAGAVAIAVSTYLAFKRLPIK